MVSVELAVGGTGCSLRFAGTVVVVLDFHMLQTGSIAEEQMEQVESSTADTSAVVGFAAVRESRQCGLGKVAARVQRSRRPCFGKIGSNCTVIEMVSDQMDWTAEAELEEMDC